MTKPAYFLAVPPRDGAARWYAEIEISGRTYAATGETLRECAQRLQQQTERNAHATFAI